MTERILHVHIEDDDAFFSRAEEAFHQISAESGTLCSEHLSFTTLSQWHSVFSAKRTALLRAIRASGATSIRALAKLVGRDYKSVHQDVQRLNELGLVEKRTDGLIEAPYDRIVSDINFVAPTADQSHQTALLDGRRNEARKKRVRLERA